MTATLKKGSSIAVSYNFNSRGTAFSAWEPGTTTRLNNYVLISEGHKNWRGSSGDVGGVFSLDKLHIEASPGYVNYKTYYGPHVHEHVQYFSKSATPTFKSDSDLDALGTTAIARSLPTNPTVGMAAFLGELREGVPRSIGSGLLENKTGLARSAGSEYLNVEFGWKPMINDLRKFATAIKRSNSLIDQYRNDSGSKIRRRYLFPPVSNVTTGTGNAIGHPRVPVIVASGSATNTATQSSWFSGAFRYYLPLGDDISSRLARYEAYANRIFGTRLTPDVVWQLAPWSWAADWFSNTGDIIHNISALGLDGLVMQYGYMMSSNERIFEMYAKNDPRWPAASSSYKETSSRKQRRPATPYGFGLSFDDLTARQAAIVVALGLSRS